MGGEHKDHGTVTALCQLWLISEKKTELPSEEHFPSGVFPGKQRLAAVPDRASVLGSNHRALLSAGSILVWERGWRAATAICSKRSQTEHLSNTTGEHEINSPREKKTGEGSLSLSSGTTESHRATQNMFPSALWSCKFMLQPLEPGRAGFASSLVRCLSEKARGVQKNALWKWVDDPVPARGKRKCHFPDDRAKIASKGRGSPLLRGLSLTIRESEPFG